VHISLFKKWLYFGWTKEQLTSCAAAIYAHNRRSLLIGSLATAVIITLLAFYHDVAERKIYLLFAALELLVFVLTRISISKNSGSTNHFAEENGIKDTVADRQRIFLAAGIALFSLIIILFSSYVCIFGKSIYVVRFLLFFLIFEVLFIFGALVCLLFNILILAFFGVIYISSGVFFGVKIDGTQYFDLINMTIGCIITATFNWYVSYIFIKNFITTKIIEEERNTYKEESIRDQLTQLNNRRSFEQSIDFFTTVCRNVHQTVCVVMMDIDFFKKYNDYYGHIKGDDVLKAVGGVLKKISDEHGVFTARVGGEEFIIIWTENRVLEAERVVLKVRQMILDLKIPHNASTVAPCVTASFGLYIMRGGSTDSTTQLYDAADSALYIAKENGRNCIYLLDSADKTFRKVELRHPDELPER